MLEQLIGQSLGRYQIVQLLGEGGMGAVFKARDAALQRDVAVKVMHPQFARQANFQERFLQEARTAAHLDHPGIVRVFDFGQAQSLLYIVMEFIPGQSLRRKLDDLKAASQLLPLPEASQLARLVSLAIDYAHRQGILHRDIKPDNIMLKPEPAEGLPYRPILTDLGLAKLLEGGLLTLDGMSMGTPSYMSPEQALGEPTDARSDVYSLGILLYELAAGRLPFAISTLTEAIRYHTKEPPPPPRSLRPELPVAVEQAILTALQKDPARRFPSAAALAEALLACAPGPAQDVAGATVVGPAGQATQIQQGEALRGASVLGEFPKASPASGQDQISIRAPDGAIRTVPFKGQEMLIGRSPESDIVLDYGSVSRQHARVQFDGNNYQVVDLNSTNGTFLANSKLLPGVPEAWAPDKALRIGDCWLRLERGPQTAAGSVSSAPGAGGQAARPEPSRVAAFLSVPEITVDPGGSALLAVTILNQGSVVDHFQASLSGLPAAWLADPAPVIRLLPGTQQQVNLVIHPPRSPESRAGTYPLAVRVTSQDAPGQFVEVQGRLTVNPYQQFRAEFKPQSVHAGQTAQIRVENQGNALQSFVVTWQDRGEELAFEPPQAQLAVPEGETGAIEFRAQARHRRWIGGQKSHPYTAQVKPATGEAQVANGEAVSRGLIPAWLPPLVVVPLITLCIMLIMFIRRPPTIQSITVDPPNPLAGQPVTVHWVVENAQSIELRPLVSDLEPSAGQYTFPDGLPVATAFTLVATNRFGSAERPLEVTVLERPAEPPVVEEWSISPIKITKGQAVKIRWRVSNAESVTLQPFGTVDRAGEMQDTPQQTIRYTLFATNKGKTVEKSQEVVVEPPAPDAPEITSFAADPNTVVKGAGGTVRLSWDTKKADSVAIEPGIGPAGPVGYRDLPAPASDTTYTLIAKNAGGEVRSEAPVQVKEPTPTPTPSPAWKHPVTLASNRTTFHLRLTSAGQIKVSANWSGTQSQLAIIINGPGQAGYYARQDGASPLEATYNVTKDDLAKGAEWRVTLASLGSGKASGTVSITYPSGSSISPYADGFAVQPDYARSVSVIVLRRLSSDAGGTIQARANWTGTPPKLSLMLNGPANLFARQDGASPLQASFAATDADLDKGDTWRVSLVSFSPANANGEIELFYPYTPIYLIKSKLPLTR